MSAQNEHYLEKIRSLEEENALLKESLSIANNNLSMKEYQLRLATQERDYISETLGWQELQSIIGKWYASSERADTMNAFLNRMGDENAGHLTQETSEEDNSTKGCDCIDIENHERYKLSEEDKGYE